MLTPCRVQGNFIRKTSIGTAVPCGVLESRPSSQISPNASMVERDIFLARHGVLFHCISLDTCCDTCCVTNIEHEHCIQRSGKSSIERPNRKTSGMKYHDVNMKLYASIVEFCPQSMFSSLTLQSNELFVSQIPCRVSVPI